MGIFKLHSPFASSGSQPEAIKELAKNRPSKSVLLGVTGSGKTFTVSQVIASQNKPVLVLSPNKTLAAQLFEEFSLFFPENKVCYFVSYYDYYQPESYLPAQDVFIPKETKINSEIERLRVETVASLTNRNDVIVVASVSAIYSLGNPEDYRNLALSLKIGQQISRSEFLHRLVEIQYSRNDTSKNSGTFQVVGNSVNIVLPYQKDVLRVELSGDQVSAIMFVEKQNNNILMSLDNAIILPAKYFVATKETALGAVQEIRKDLHVALSKMQNPIYKERLEKRISYDIEMIEQTGFCSGIENYSKYFDGRKEGERPYCLFDFFPKDFLLIVDESHIAIPQIGGMYAGDRSRKSVLIEYGFRLPSALDNRPLKFEEAEQFFKDVIFVSATPGKYEMANKDNMVEQIIRPTGLVDPEIEIHSRIGQMDHLVDQIRQVTESGFRTLVIVLTKKLAEETAEYLEEKKIKSCYLHSDLKTPQRTEILMKLRSGVFDCLVGVNLLREGIDLPEVALVAIMDADIEGFLRDKRSLIQIVGRAARNVHSKVILYADKITESMRATMEETRRRRDMQIAYNVEHGIVAQSVKRDVTKSIIMGDIEKARNKKGDKKGKDSSDKKSKSKKSYENNVEEIDLTDLGAVEKRIAELEKMMSKAADKFDFERAILLREEWMRLKQVVDN